MKLPVEIPLFQIFQYGQTNTALNIDLVTVTCCNSQGQILHGLFQLEFGLVYWQQEFWWAPNSLNLTLY